MNSIDGEIWCRSIMSGWHASSFSHFFFDSHSARTQGGYFEPCHARSRKVTDGKNINNNAHCFKMHGCSSHHPRREPCRGTVQRLSLPVRRQKQAGTQKIRQYLKYYIGKGYIHWILAFKSYILKYLTYFARSFVQVAQKTKTYLIKLCTSSWFGWMDLIYWDVAAKCRFFLPGSLAPNKHWSSFSR